MGVGNVRCIDAKISSNKSEEKKCGKLKVPFPPTFFFSHTKSKHLAGLALAIVCLFFMLLTAAVLLGP